MRIEALFLIANVALTASSGLSRPRNGAHLFLPHPTSLHAQIQILARLDSFAPHAILFIPDVLSSLFPAALVPGATLSLATEGLAVSEISTSAAVGDTSFPVASVDGFQVGGVVRLHPGYPNQEDHRIRAISHTSLWLASSGLEFAHTSKEAVELLPIVPDCPNNCSSIASCVERVCACPEGYMGEDCSIARVQCPFNCYGHGLCIGGLCSCHAGYTGGSCQFTAQLCPFNCSGHGLCSEAGVCACEPGFTGADCSMATPDCLNNCTGHGTCANSECTCDFGYSGNDCSVVVGGCPGNCSAHGECLRNGECLCEAGYGAADCGSVSAFALCESNCSGHGACVFGECRCDAGFGGPGCDTVLSACARNCSGHGLCEAQLSAEGNFIFGCACEVGFAGPTCEIVKGGCPGMRSASSIATTQHSTTLHTALTAPPSPFPFCYTGNCTGHGACFNGTCHCDIGFGTPDCSIVQPVCERNCSGHGRCTDGVCECHDGYNGPSCSRVAGLCPRNCSGHGECDEMSARCICDDGYAGRDCGMVDAPCPRDCSQRGTCVGGACECLPGFSGRGCEVACPNRCSGHGDCISGKCQCHTGHKGTDCSGTSHLAQAASMVLQSPFSGDWFNGAAPPEALYQDLTRPLFVVVIAGCGILILTCVLGYLVNLCRGARGTDAIPYYNWAMSTLSISDYQLKPNPRPQGM